MKELLIILGGIFFYQALMAQSWSEWFEQNHTQLAYLQEQIAALRAVQVTQQAGYAVSENGLEIIDSTTTADFDQHAAHFAYLRRPSANVLNDPRVAQIDTLLERSLLLSGAILSLNRYHSDAASDGAPREFARTLKEAVGYLSTELRDVLAADKLQMSDSERERVIVFLKRESEAVYERACRFLKALTTKISLL